MIEESLRCLFRHALIKLFYKLQNRRQQRRQKSRQLIHFPNQDKDHHYPAVIRLLKQPQTKNQKEIPDF